MPNDPNSDSYLLGVLGAGAMVDEARERVVGFKRPIEHEEAEKLLSGFVDDTAMQRVLATNPLVTEVSEYIITTSDAAVSGHLGFSAYAAEGDHRDVLARLHRLVKATRVCRGCLLDAWVDYVYRDTLDTSLRLGTDALRMLRAQVLRTPPGQWVRVVGGFAELQFAEKRLPTPRTTPP